MKIRTIILAGGEGKRLGVLTAKRAKPAVPFAGKYRIIDFTLSNCTNSNLFDVVLIAQYRPHSLIEHIGVGGPWDLNREFTGGIRIFTPYKSRGADWFIGTADAVQQNFGFLKNGNPDLLLILSADHIYTMDYLPMIQFHLEHQAELTIATIQVPLEEASRYGVLGIGENQRIISFIEKPEKPPFCTVNMGVYLFNTSLLDKVLWEDHLKADSAHDFGKNVLPALVNGGARVFAYPFSGYWMDVGTVESYWQSHIDLLGSSPALDLYNRSWIIHTRSEERPPAAIQRSAIIEDSLICDGCVIERGAQVIRSVLSPGVIISEGSVIKESIILTNSTVQKNVSLERSIIDKKVNLGEGSSIGGVLPDELLIAMVGKSSIIPPFLTIQAGGVIGPDVIPSDISTPNIKKGEFVQTRRLPYEI
jgi:glucose-1-phosphate adenylyltransferase